MANIKSKQKRVLTNEKARLRNKSVRSAVRTEIRKFRALVEAGDKAGAEAQLRKASRALDKSVSKGVFHRNNAARSEEQVRRKGILFPERRFERIANRLRQKFHWG